MNTKQIIKNAEYQIKSMIAQMETIKNPGVKGRVANRINAFIYLLNAYTSLLESKMQTMTVDKMIIKLLYEKFKPFKTQMSELDMKIILSEIDDVLTEDIGWRQKEICSFLHYKEIDFVVADFDGSEESSKQTAEALQGVTSEEDYKLMVNDLVKQIKENRNA